MTVDAPRALIQLRRPLLGALIGLLSVGVALTAGELAAAFVRPASAPIIVVGNKFILLAPESLKRSAIKQFGTHDKLALLSGVYLVIALLAIVVGVLSLRKPQLGYLGIAIFGGVGVWAALTVHAHRGTDVVPSIVAATAGIAALSGLLRLVRNTPDPVAPLLADRRLFLQTGVAMGGGALLAGLAGRAVGRDRYSVAKTRASTLLPPSVSAPATARTGYDLGASAIAFQTPSDRFYRIDTALSVPQIDPKSWRLRIHGMVDKEITLSYADLLSRPLIERWVTLCCVSNDVGGDLIGTAIFKGVRLADILREAGVAPGADQLVASSSDGMTIGSPTAVVMDGRDAMLVVGMNGQVLPIEHGYPVRMVVPGLYGYVSACKWIVDLEATTFAKAQPYWVQGGWAAQAPVLLSSRIDTPKSGKHVSVGSTVPIAGVAWDQHVGVSKVQVQVDDGAWLPTTLAAVPSTDTWRQWVLPWQVPSKGKHTIKVRAYDGTGKAQDEQVRPPFPSGATGLHTITVDAG